MNRKLLLLLPLLIVMPVVLADDGSGCLSYGSALSPYQSNCYAPQIYQQNQQIIKLDEISICYDIYNVWWQTHGAPFGEIGTQDQCIAELENATK